MNRDKSVIPNMLYHYYESFVGPFVNLSDLPIDEAEIIQSAIREQGKIFASKRAEDYHTIRRELEDKVRALFIEKGGKPKRKRPHYMTLGSCDWLKEWYLDGQELYIPLESFNPHSISFTYGDTFPAMRYQDGKPYRGKVYTLDEIVEVIRAYGLPQEWNRDGKLGPERYIEVQVWDDEPLKIFT
jgi:hypothetical protein